MCIYVFPWLGSKSSFPTMVPLPLSFPYMSFLGGFPSLLCFTACLSLMCVGVLWCVWVQSLQVPLAVCQPYPSPSRPPPSLLLSLRLTHPQLYHRLTHPANAITSPGLWDVCHWMWPLFGDHWDTLRDRYSIAQAPSSP